jgi:hypothetical protein
MDFALAEERVAGVTLPKGENRDSPNCAMDRKVPPAREDFVGDRAMNATGQ